MAELFKKNFEEDKKGSLLSLDVNDLIKCLWRRIIWSPLFKIVYDESKYF